MAELHSASIPIQTLYTWYRKGQLIVNRRYQRKLVWTLLEKQKLIDSILRKYPVPAILLAELEGPEEKYEIIDGLQRLHAVLSFIEHSFPDLDGRYFDIEYFPFAAEIQREGGFERREEVSHISDGECATVLNYPLSISTLRRANDDEVNEVFDRINTYGHRLSDQERRQAGVQNEFADLVRQLASELRGDVSADSLELYRMPSISIDLPKMQHGYMVKAEEVFWVEQGVLRSTELRDSLDEQVIADIIACMVGQDLIDRSKSALDAIYESGSDEAKRIETALNLFGSERARDEFKYVIGEIRAVCSEGGEEKLRSILFKEPTTNPFPSLFAALFMAIYESGVKSERRIADYAALRAAIRGVNQRVSAGQKGSNAKERRTNIDAIKGLIDRSFVDDPRLAGKIYNDHKVVDIEASIRRSEIELSNYELKQGLLPLDPKETDPTRTLQKVLKTIAAIANIGPDTSGKVILGVADVEDDARRATEIDKITPKVVGRKHVVGVAREAKRIGISLEEYHARIVEGVRKSALSEALAGC